MKIVHVIRHKNPRFFSIENVFENVRSAWPSMEVPEEFTLPKTGFSLANIFSLLKLRFKISGGIFHITGDVHYAALCLPRKRTLLTIHDCVFVNRYSGFKGRLIRLLYLDLPVKYLQYITTVSEKTRQEIIELTGCRPGKISVIGNPVSSELTFRRKEFNDEVPVMLFIGTTPNKNLERVCMALTDIPCVLYIIGTLDAAQREMLDKSGIEYVAKAGLSNIEMAEMYSYCDIVVYPSLYEGFGLPIIEGFVSGRVVVTSNLSPLRDIAADAAILVDPHNVDSIKIGILNAINNSLLRDRLISNGFREATNYLASNIAIEYMQLYQTIDSGK